jgi:FMN-dependent NADH-azoreductase
MTHLLQIDVSPRIARSVSRLLAQEFVEQWMINHSENTVTYRDIGKHPVPHITEEWMEEVDSPKDELVFDLTNNLSISDELVDELFLADQYLISTPIFNFTIPSTLKAYIDQIVRIGLTVTIDKDGSRGRLQNKKLLVIATQRDNYQPGTIGESLNYFEPYLRHVFGFIGVDDINFIYAYNQSRNYLASKTGVLSARESIQSIVSCW